MAKVKKEDNTTDAPAPRKTTYKVQKVSEDRTVTINFLNPETGDVITSISLSLDELSAQMIDQLAMHGIKQKLGDSTAGEKMVEAALANVQRITDQLRRDEFRATRESGSKGPRTSDLAEALHRATGKPIDRCIAVVSEMGDEEKSGLRKSPRIQVELRKISLERAEKKAATEEVALPDLGL